MKTKPSGFTLYTITLCPGIYYSTAEGALTTEDSTKAKTFSRYAEALAVPDSNAGALCKQSITALDEILEPPVKLVPPVRSSHSHPYVEQSRRDGEKGATVWR